MQITLFAFAEGTGISEEAYQGDTCYLALEGEMPLFRKSKTYLLLLQITLY